MRIYELSTKYKAVGFVPSVSSIRNGFDVFAYMRTSFDHNPMQEQFWVIMLNSGNVPMCRYMCTIGLVNEAHIHPREAFRMAIKEGAVSVIFVHNHPSGNTTPSHEDIKVTKRLVEAGELLNIPVLDHIIMGDNWTSIKVTNPTIFK